MSDELNKLLDRVNQLGKEENWDGVITACTDLISRLDKPVEKAEAYTKRGIAYSKKEEHDKAIADYDKAIDLNPKDKGAHLYRGIIYVMEDKLAEAIKDFSKAIKLDPVYAEAYRYRGIAYGLEGKFGKAIKDFDKAIGLNLKDMEIYLYRGMAYKGKGKYEESFDDYMEAKKYGKNIQLELPDVYIVFRLVRIFNGSQVPSALKSAYLGLLSIVEGIRLILLYQGNEGGEVAHYTSLDVLKNLVDTNTDTDTNNHSFRLYNAAYMNDPEEGRVFFEVMKGYGYEMDLEKIFYSKDNTQRSPAYIGSFVKIEPDKDKDKLFLWRTYGKNDDKEAAGACLIFDREQFDSSLRLLKMDGMYRIIERSDFPQKPELYRVIYEVKSGEKLSNQLGALSEALKAISNFCQSEKEKSLVDELTQLVRELLDNIRFLFKADHYQQEEEVRVIAMFYQENKEPSSKYKIDMDRMPPRFYLEMPKDIKPSEVILGPRAVRVPEWKQWLKGKDKCIEVKESKIPFGKSV